MAGRRKNADASSKQSKAKAKVVQSVRFDQKLAFHRWLLGLFGVEKFEDLAKMS